MNLSRLSSRTVRRLSLPGAVLVALLQRSPVANLFATAEEALSSPPGGAILKSAFATAAALGTVTTLVGATPIVPSSGSATGVTVTTGAAVSVFYTVNGTLTPPLSWTISGSIPPGMDFSGLTAAGEVDVNTGSSALHLEGTPTTAGTYRLSLIAYEFAGAQGIASPTYAYTITVNGGGGGGGGGGGSPVTSVTATTGHGATFSAGSPAGTIQWQISTDNGATWTNLANNGTYGGVTTGTLTVSNVGSAMNGAQYRYQVDDNGTLTSSNAGTLTVAPVFFPFPTCITIDSSGTLYVGDSSADTIQKIGASGQVSLLAGANGTSGSADGTGSAARFNQPGGITMLPGGSLAVSDTANATLRAVTTGGVVTTLAGMSGTRGGADGMGTAASFSSPMGIGHDSGGNMYLADSMNDTIRKVTSSAVVSTLAGSAGMTGTASGAGGAARFNFPTGVTVDGSGNLFVTDTTNNTVREVTSAGVVTTFAGIAGVSGWADGPGTSALFNHPGGIVVDASGTLYVADTGNSVIRKISSAGVVVTLAGVEGVAGLEDGNGTAALFDQPKDLAIDSSGNLYVADTGNAAIRKVTAAGTVSTMALSPAQTVAAPMITSQPQSATTTVGSSFSLSVTASGSALSYQWRQGSSAIAGATGSSYSKSSAASSDAGSYTVVVSNSAGSVTSSAAMVTVNAAPASGGSSGGGGGGAPSVGFLAILAALCAVRRLRGRPEGPARA